jgi:ribosome biogenesis GTPase
MASLRSRALREGVAVGDWVLIGSGDAVEVVLPRRTVLLRKAAGERAEPQPIAANVDRVLVVTSCDADFNVRRLERYLVAISASGAEARIVLTKADVVDDPTPFVTPSSELAPTLLTSAKSGLGLDELRALVGARGTTSAFVGSSGVGKSALVNILLGSEVQREGAVRAYDGRGRHTTTKRTLFFVPGGGLVIDTPGMREFQPWEAPPDDAFEDVLSFAASCRFRDCSHEREPGCAVRAAVASGELPEARYHSWKKLRASRT